MSLIDDELMLLAARAGELMKAHGLMLTTAESCTGGMVAAAMTSIAGSSDWFERGFVTYSNEAKHDMLGVPTALISLHGAVSEAVARAMCEGALKHSRAHLSVSITGIAGPTGGSADKPVGLVWFGVARREGGGAITAQARQRQFDGDRAAVRQQAARFALQEIIATIKA